MVTLDSCPNCEVKQLVEHSVFSGGVVESEITKGVKVYSSIIVRYVKCLNCDLIFQNPRLSDQELDIYYGSGYYRKTINPPPEGMDKGEEIRAEVDLDIVKKYTSNNFDSHLDIGCGRGYFLNKVNAKLQVGTESDPKYVKYKNIDVYTDIQKITHKSFDLVSALHVLEHVPYPLKFLKAIVKYMNKTSYLILEVPSLKTRGGPLGFAHLSYFETDVLKLMCRQAGLKIINTEFTPHLFLICQKS